MGFASIKKNLKIILVLVALIGIAGTAYLSFKARNISDQNVVIPSDNLQLYKPKVVVAVGDMVCDPANTVSSDNKCQMVKTYEIATAQKPSAVLALGDLQYNDATFDKFQTAYAKSWGQLKGITYPVVGNHEYLTQGASGYFDYFNGINSSTGRAGNREAGYYSFNLGFWHVMALNANCENIGGCGEGSAQYQWLKNDLEQNKNRKCSMSLWHQPHFSSGPHGVELADTSRSVPFWKLLYEKHADLILNGHDHLYERFAKQDPDGKATAAGIRQFTVGTGGNSLYALNRLMPNSEVTYNQSFGILTLKLYPSAYKWLYLSTQNKVIDQGFTRCNT